ncbi:MurR/RpiR family transcriptional regulator [Rhizorhabdus histidinilytica]
MRDGVRLVDLGAGNYADIFATDTSDSCLVVIDIRRYSRQSYLVAEQASQQGIPLIVLTDLFCDWAQRFTPHVLAVPTQTGLFWSSPVALVCAANLLVNDVIKLIGPGSSSDWNSSPVSTRASPAMSATSRRGRSCPEAAKSVPLRSVSPERLTGKCLTAHPEEGLSFGEGPYRRIFPASNAPSRQHFD